MSRIVRSIEGFIVEVKKVQSEFLKIEKDIIFVYRGESKNFGKTKLTPSLFRDYSQLEVIDIENKIHESVSDMKISEKEELIETAIDTQHYLALSRFLDVTFNSLVALYFAIEKAELNKNPIVYVFAIPKFLVFSPHSKYLSKHYENILNSEETTQHTFKLILNSFTNERIMRQDGGFLLMSGTSSAHIDKEVYYDEIEICYDCIETIKSELKTLFNISISKIFPEAEKQVGKLKEEISNRKYYHKDNCTELQLFSKKILYELKVYKDKDRKKYLRMLRKKKEEYTDYLEKNCKNDGCKEEKIKDKLKELEDEIKFI